MALFGLFNYAKPGKGVSKNAPEKHRFFLFFELYFRKFWKLLLVNFMYAIIIFPLFSAAYIGIMMLLGINPMSFEDATTQICVGFLFGLPQPISLILVIASAVLMGPSTAAATYIWRNFARQEHAWVWTDFWERFKSNFRQGLALGLIDILVVVCFALYMTIGAINNRLLNQYLLLFRYVAVVMVIIYLFMRNFTYLIAVTFEMRLFAIIRNSWIFAVLGIVRNLCTLLFTAIVIAVTAFAPLPLIFLLSCSLCGFISAFNAWPVIEKYMLAPRVENEDGSITILEQEDVPEDKGQSLFSDDASAPKKDNDEE